MAKNRKHQSAAVRFGPALKAFLLCALIGGSGVGYVWQKSRIEELSKQIKEREQKLGRAADEQREIAQAARGRAVAAESDRENRQHEARLGAGEAGAGLADDGAGGGTAGAA